MTQQYQLTPLTQINVGVYGPPKTFKTTFGLTMTRPLVDFDLDRSFARAEARFRAANPTDKIVVVSPTDTLEQYLDQDWDVIIRSYNIPVKLPGQPINIWRNLWSGLVLPDIVNTFQHPRIKSGLIDTGTVAWKISREAFMEKVIEKDGTRVQMSRIEYREPNAEMFGLLGIAPYHGKNLMMLHHDAAKFQGGQEVGRTWDGFNHLGGQVDLVIVTDQGHTCTRCNKVFLPSRNSMEHTGHQINETPIQVAMIETSGYSVSFQGTLIVEPTFDKVMSELNIIRLNELVQNGI